MSRNAFAARYGLAPRTVEGWELGQRPDSPAVALLRIINRDAMAAEFMRYAFCDRHGATEHKRVLVRRLLEENPATRDAQFSEHVGHDAWRLGSRVATMALAFWPLTTESCIVIGVASAEYLGLEASPEVIAALIASYLVPADPRDNYRVTKRAEKIAHEEATGRAGGRCESCGKAGPLQTVILKWSERLKAEHLQVRCVSYCGPWECVEV